MGDPEVQLVGDGHARVQQLVPQPSSPSVSNSHSVEVGSISDHGVALNTDILIYFTHYSDGAKQW